MQHMRAVYFYFPYSVSIMLGDMCWSIVQEITPGGQEKFACNAKMNNHVCMTTSYIMIEVGIKICASMVTG